MYFTKCLVGLLTILGSSNIWTAEGLRERRTTTKSPLTSSTALEADMMGEESEKRYHHKPQDPPHTQPQLPQQYPPPYLPQNPPQLPQQYPTQNSPQVIPEYPPHYPPQDPPKIPPQNPQFPHKPPQYQPQNPPQYLQLIPPQVIQQNPPNYTPQLITQNPPNHSPQVITQNPPIYPPQVIKPHPPHYQSQYPQQKPPIQYPPSSPSLILPTPTIILDQFDNRHSDGSYEFRYELSDESVRYEKGYFIYYQQTKILVVKGYYSHRLPDRRYLTVFYTADQFGNRQNSYFSSYRPQLPRSLNVEDDTIEDIIKSAAVEN